MKEEKWGSGVKSPEKFMTTPFFPLKNTLFEHKDRPFIHKSFVNERAKMKESRQNYREIRVCDDNKMENTNARSPLTFRNLL